MSEQAQDERQQIGAMFMRIGNDIAAQGMDAAQALAHIKAELRDLSTLEDLEAYLAQKSLDDLQAQRDAMQARIDALDAQLGG